MEPCLTGRSSGSLSISSGAPSVTRSSSSEGLRISFPSTMHSLYRVRCCGSEVVAGALAPMLVQRAQLGPGIVSSDVSE